jgi:NAD(P)H-dependent FMN reductase
VLLISGSLREGSTNGAVLRTAAELAGDGVTTTLYGGMAKLPHFNPDDDREGEPVHVAVADLRAQIAAADAVLLCTPEYAGALPGSLKNLLEWTVGDGGTYRKPIAWINASGPAAPTGGADAHDSLRKVLHPPQSAQPPSGISQRRFVTRNESAGRPTDGKQLIPITTGKEEPAMLEPSIDLRCLRCDTSHTYKLVPDSGYPEQRPLEGVRAPSAVTVAGVGFLLVAMGVSFGSDVLRNDAINHARLARTSHL